MSEQTKPIKSGKYIIDKGELVPVSKIDAQALEIEKLKSELEEMKRNWYQSNKERAQFEAELEAVKAERDHWYQKYQQQPNPDIHAKLIEERDRLQSRVDKLKKAVNKIVIQKYGFSHEEYCDIVDKHLKIVREALAEDAKLESESGE